jgi:hypothetical protein
LNLTEAGFVPASLALVPPVTGIVSAAGGDGVAADLSFISSLTGAIFSSAALLTHRYLVL